MPKSSRLTVILKRACSSTKNYTRLFWKVKKDGTYDKFKVEKLQEGDDKLKELKE